MQRTHGDNTVRITRTQHKRCGFKIPPTRLLISETIVDEVLEVGEDRATTLVLEKDPRVSRSAVEMARMYVITKLEVVLE